MAERQLAWQRATRHGICVIVIGMPMPMASGGVRPARYRLYIDESGDHTFNLLDDPARRYLALLGVWFRQADDYVSFADAWERLKREFFGPRPDAPVIFHREDILNRRGPFFVLRDDATRNRFDEALLAVITQAKYTLVCVVIDKQEQMDAYEDPFHPYDYCLAAMLERYCGWLGLKNAVGDAMAESRGRVEDRQLRAAYRHVYTNGTSFIRPERFQRVLTTHDLKVEPKAANVAGLQLADLLAYPVKRSCLAERDRLAVQPGTFGARVVQCIEGKYNRRLGTGEVEGYGMVWLPVSRKNIDPAWEKATEGLKPIRKIPRKEREHP